MKTCDYCGHEKEDCGCWELSIPPVQSGALCVLVALVVLFLVGIL